MTRRVLPLVLALVATGACSGRETINARLVTPQGELDTRPSQVRIVLDRPLFDASQPLSEPLAADVEVKPPVAYQLAFPTPNTIEIAFPGELPPATDYEVTLRRGLLSADGKAELKSDAVAKFRTPLNRVERVATTGEGWSGPAISLARGDDGRAVTTGTIASLGPTEALGIAFRYPISQAQAEALVQVFVKDGVELPIVRELSPAPGSELVVRPQNPWPADTPIVLSIGAGLKVADAGAGPLATKQTQAFELHTWRPLAIEKGPPPPGTQCVAGKSLSFVFNNPVSCEAMQAHVQTGGDREVRCVTSLPSREVRFELVPAPLPEEEVELTFTAGLPDAFGQALAAARSFPFARCPGDMPRFAYQRPFVILDPGLASEHVERVSNAKSVKVEGRRVTLQQLWKVIDQQKLGEQVAWTELPWWMTDEYVYEWYDGERREPGELLVSDIPELASAQSVTVPVDRTEGWSDVSVGLEQFLGGPRGLVLMRLTPIGAKGVASEPQLRIANVTDIGLTVRASADTMLVLAASYETGKPLAGVALTVMDEKGTVLGQAETGADGTARIPAAALAEVSSLHRTKVLVAAKKGDDEAFVWSRFVTEGVYGDDVPQPVGLVYADRGIYRPGETVRLKGIARIASKQGFANPAGQQVTLRVLDPDGNEALSRTSTLSAYGTTDAEVAIPANARLGDWRIELSFGREATLYGSFMVGEFRRAEMKVDVQAPNRVHWGETLKASIQGDYLFGAPAAGLTVEWSLTRRSDRFRSKRFPRASFLDPASPEWSWYDSSTRVLADGSAKLDDKGTFRITQPLKFPAPVAQYENLTISGTVEDANGQSISRQGSVEFFNAGVLVGVQTPSYLLDSKKPTTVTIVALTPDDAAAANVPVVLTTRQTWWRSIRRAGPGNGFYWTSERVVESDVERCRGRTGADGTFQCELHVEKGGTIQLVATATDAKGRQAGGSSWHWVYGDANYWGGADDQQQATILFDRSEVTAGETAKVAITSPFKEGVALVTVEREDILWQKSIEIGTNATIEIPTSEAWAPNVHVVATVVRGRLKTAEGATPDPEREKPAYAIGRRELTVKPARASVDVNVAVAQPRLEPGEEQRATVTVTSRDGKPVADAEVNLWAVDEGVLMLTNYRTPDPIASVFRQRGYRTLGLDTRAYVLGKRVFVEPVTKGEEDGGGGGDENDASVRRHFDPLAVWIGAKVTDANGRVEATFTVPDTLTTYRVMAVAVTKDDRFGHGETEFKVNKTLMLRQAMSRFVRPGDAFKAGVLVNQISPSAGKVTVRLESIDETLFTVKGPREQTFDLAPNQTIPVTFDVSAHDVEGAAEIRFAAQMGSFRDRVELVLPVVRVTPRESIVTSGIVDSGTLTASLSVPALARATSMEVNVSGMPLSSLEGRIRDLVQYPYGCLEQRTSRVLPLVAVRRLAQDLEFKSIPTEKIQTWVDEWVAIVPKFRCDDGGFDYWPGCSYGSNTYLTAYTLEALLTARRYGYEVPESEIRRSVEYLQRQLRQPSRNSGDRSTGALRVLAEAGTPEPELEKASFAARGNMPLFAKAELTRAMAFRLGTEATQNPDVKTLVAEIASAGREEGDRLVFPASGSDDYWWAWESAQRNTALVLRTFLQVAPDDGRIPLLVRGLVELDRGATYWTTQGVTQTLLAIAEAVSVLKPTSGGPKATLKVAGNALATELALGPALKSFPVPEGALTGTIPIEIANTGDRPLFFGASLAFAYPATVRLPARANGYQVTRTYLDADGRPIPVKRDGERRRLQVKAGDFVRVRLSIEADEAGRFVIVDDPLPAGLEAVDARLATSNAEQLRRMGEGQRGSWWRNQHRELRDDRVEWHFEHGWRGTTELEYVARAITPGTFHAPGTHVERMYQPHVNGRAEALDVTVVAKEQ